MIQSLLTSIEGACAVAARSLDPPGWQLLINEREPFHAASTMKVPVMVECYRQAHAGRFALNEEIRVENRFRSIVDGSPYILDPADDSRDGPTYVLVLLSRHLSDVPAAVETLSHISRAVYYAAGAS